MSAATISLHFRRLLLAGVFNPGPQNSLSSLYVALTRVVGVANATGLQLDEPVAAGYARAAYPVDNESWTLTDYAQAYNINDVVFPVAVEDWGYIQGYALCTDSESGATLAVGRLTTPVYVSAGMQLAVRAGSVVLELTD